ncbi:hypothetical protein EVAR_41893_1 [Eumeta japonica]|uniref:Uncharacterized protein n=1 Tax=Eumeta variegata TaxID=151549 RepID=A0A4C1YLY5_EUMVA|nr:hypothetical protein EVAR_41893_1 [Eumeta japonica]
MLLHHVRGPTSFQYLKTVDGVLKETYQAACRARVRTESNAAETMTHRYDTNNLTAFVNENLPNSVRSPAPNGRYRAPAPSALTKLSAFYADRCPAAPRDPPSPADRESAAPPAATLHN